MDAIVLQAMSKWPNVPHCYGWLLLDRRGHWRMRDEHAQQLGLPGDKIAHQALLGFINRNYTADAQGNWYFQNGPQRVFVDLELTPYVIRTDPVASFVLHTGAALPELTAVWMTQAGQLILVAGAIVAAVDDRDLAGCLAALSVDGKPANDEQILEWIETRGQASLTLEHAGKRLPVQWIAPERLAGQCGFTLRPRAPGPASGIKI